MKHDYLHHLFFCLEWLNDGSHQRTREPRAGWGKSLLHEDTIYVLLAIVEGLDDHLQWPDGNRRVELANVFPGIFNDCIGIADVTEYQVVKYKDNLKERQSWSGKKINNYKCLSLVDHSGRFIFVRVTLGNNNRECYTTSPLYLEEGDYFSDNQFVATDGAFDGDGRFLCSYKNPSHDPNKIRFNSAFR